MGIGSVTWTNLNHKIVRDFNLLNGNFKSLCAYNIKKWYLATNIMIMQIVESWKLKGFTHISL